MAVLFENLRAFFSWVIQSVPDVLDLIIDNPLLILMIPGFIAVGYVVSWVGKLIRQ